MAEPLSGWRVVAKPSALDDLEGLVPVSPPSGGRAAGEAGRGVVLRLAPDDALVLSESEFEVGDTDAIIERDTGWVGLSMREEQVLELIARSAAWQAPRERPAFAQGMLAGLPAKVYLDGDESMVIVAAPFEHELEERVGR